MINPDNNEIQKEEMIILAKIYPFANFAVKQRYVAIDRHCDPNNGFPYFMLK
jgi:hypothetical protein